MTLALRRSDGWPLCPVCGEDELADLEAGCAPDRRWPDGDWQASPEAELYCYRCGRVTARDGLPVA